jgi:acyl-CoA hydrolase
MDVAACLSAERHAQIPCVTVSVDNITFQTSVRVGHVVVLKAVVNRSFKSSLEVGLVVESEDPFTGARQHICKAFFVFVAKPSDGGKVQLPPLSPVTGEEKREFLLAAERRRMRTTYAKDILRIVRNIHQEKKRTSSLPSTLPSSTVPASATVVHTVQIVLPVHANHHGTTFGGQIMEWMTDVATLSGLRLSHSALKLEGIESVHFRGPSHVGERVSLQSSVNRTFSGNRFCQNTFSTTDERHAPCSLGLRWVFVWRATQWAERRGTSTAPSSLSDWWTKL